MRRATACLLLVLVGGPAADGGTRQSPFDPLVAELGSADPSVRVRALRALDATDDPNAAAFIAALARDPEDGIQIEAIGATLRLLLGEPVTGRRDDPAGALAAFDADLAPVVAVPPAIYEHLAAAMGDLSVAVRRQAASAVAVLAGARPADVPSPAASVIERALVAMLGAAAPGARVTAARVAGRLYRAPLPNAGAVGSRAMPASVADALIALLNQPTELERLVAMESLGLAREVRAVASLAERHAYHRASGPPLEMAAALDALARAGHPSSLPLFVEALSDRRDAVRQLGYEGLARSRARDEAATELARWPVDRSAHVALAQAFARERLLADGAIDQIVEALRSSRSRDQARGYLRELGPAATGALSARVSHSDSGVRAALAEVLGRIGTHEATAALTPLASDQDPMVARAAARALRRLEAGLSAGAAAPR